MVLLGDFTALPPEVNIARLLGGPGSGSTLITAAAYAALAGQLNAAAAGIEGSTADMAASWEGLAASSAQGAFRRYSAWLHEQAAVAQQAATLIEYVAQACTVAQSEMAGVAAHLASFRVREAALAGGSSVMPGATAVLVAMEAEYLEIWAEASGVMAQYAGSAVPALSALPSPVFAPPIAAGGGGPDVPAPSPFVNPLNSGGHGGAPEPGPTGSGPSGSGPSHASTSPSSQDGSGDISGQNIDQLGTDDVRPVDPSALADMEQLEPESVGDGMDPGVEDAGSTSQQGFSGTSSESPTLAGLNGGAGSMVAFGMLRGGMGTMPGTATGFRMPGNWNSGPGRAFGASSNPVPASGAPSAPRRGVTAPMRQMRRRRDDEKKSKVFVPGEPQDIPVLEKPPVVGVIESADERHTEPDPQEEFLTIGILGRTDGESGADEVKQPLQKPSSR